MLAVANLTSLATLTYGALDVADELFEVVVAKGSYALRPSAAESETLDLVFDESATKLFVADEPFGVLNKSSVKVESDLAPFKPRCDVIVVGSAHSPTGRPMREMIVAIDVARGPQSLLSHRLRVHGERYFVRRDALDRSAAAVVWFATAGSVEAPEWYLSEPEPFVDCPLRYELAFGGETRVAADDEDAGRVPEEHKLSGEAREAHPDGPEAPIAHRACMMNPVGRGFAEAWHATATRADRYAAPRIEDASSPITPGLFHAMLHGRAACGSHPALTPQGFGVIAKPWRPRLSLAGTYDETWKSTRWPNLPTDFDMAFWNGAHRALQCPHLKGGEIVTLTNLLPAGAPGTAAGPDATLATLKLPVLTLALRLELEDGRTTYGMLAIDTLVLDLEDMVAHVVWRIRVPEGLPVRDAVLVSLADIRSKEQAMATAV